MGANRKLPTMTDVARLAGVSQSTVSLVLRGKAGENIPEATRDRIFQASSELGYRVNKLASALNSTGSGIIGMLTDELITTNFAGAIVKGAHERALGKNKILMLAALENEGRLVEKSVDMMIGYRVDSILYASMYHRRIELPSNLKDIPTVLVNCFDSENRYPAILPDDYSGAYQAAAYLIECGHRNVVYLSNEKRETVSGERLPATLLRERGFKAAFVEHGIPSETVSIIPIPITGHDVFEAATDILSSVNRPTAVMCYNDRMAMGVYSAANALGLKIPEDLSVIGYDNQTVIAEFLVPFLTTIELPHYEMGDQAVSYLFRHKYPFEAEQILISPKLIIRSSVRSISEEEYHDRG